MPELGYWGDIAVILLGLACFLVIVIGTVVAIWKAANET
jgi:hypothetical protein